MLIFIFIYFYIKKKSLQVGRGTTQLYVVLDFKKIK